MGSRFSICLPEGYTIDDAYSYQALGPGKELGGVKFTIPETKTVGTNLATDTYVSVEEVPAESCSASLFLGRPASREVVDEGRTYSVAAANGKAAGNHYEEIVYAFPRDGSCIGVRYFIHSGAIENYPADSVRPFDRAALVAEFDLIRRGLTAE
jgi:hypothetical protein